MFPLLKTMGHIYQRFAGIQEMLSVSTISSVEKNMEKCGFFLIRKRLVLASLNQYVGHFLLSLTDLTQTGLGQVQGHSCLCCA